MDRRMSFMAYDKNEVIWKDRKHFMWFPFSFVKYEIKNERLYEQKGFFTTTYDEVLLYKVIDMTLKQSLAQKIFGTGTLYLITRANNTPEVILENIKRPKVVKDMLSELVEEIRAKQNVVGKEFYGSGNCPPDNNLMNDFHPEDSNHNH
jgi:hypothetical protein